MRKPKFETLKFEKFTPGGQVLGTLESGKKIFAWGVLPGETARIKISKNKKSFAEGFVDEIIEPAKERIIPKDPESYLSTSPWQVMNYDYELKVKQFLINESFAQEKINLIPSVPVYTDGEIFNYRNKVEFSFWWEKFDESSEDGELNLAFFRRGGKGRIPVAGTSLASPEINQAGQKILALLREHKIASRDLKTVLIRANQKGEIAAQLYIKTKDFPTFTAEEISALSFLNFEIIYSNPKSPASVITERIYAQNNSVLADKILGVEFNYATEGFFQINLPVYEQALKDMSQFVDDKKPTIDLYSGVGTIGLTIGKNNLTMIEINPAAVAEMERNIKILGREESARAILSASENALDHIKKDSNLIVDPPRAGLDKKVCAKLLEIEPARIIYLSCNPTTQARDIAILSEKYDISYARGYNFFPRTPHIEHLAVLDIKK